MTTMRPRAMLLVALVLSLSACFQSGAMGDSDADPYVPLDGGPDEPDGDRDQDGDTFQGGETDASELGDGDTDPAPDRVAPEPYEDRAALCLDGDSSTMDGFDDCESLECFAERACCRTVDGSWVEGHFAECGTLEACGWVPFGSSTTGGGVTLEPAGAGWLTLSGQGVGEAGALAARAFDTSGEPTVTFLAGLGSDSAPCAPASCRHAVGVALTTEGSPSAATGITPLAGLVLDGELEAVHLYVAGRVVDTVHVGAAELAADRAYGFRVRQDRSVEFWVGREEPVDAATAPPDRLSSARLPGGTGDVFVAAFGRVGGEGAGRVGEVRIERRACDVPGAMSRVPSASVFAPGGAASRPAVIRRPTETGAPLLMVFERGGDLAVATSEDGLQWTVASDHAIVHQARHEYGLVARRAPALAHWAPGLEVPYYHMWLEGESEAEGGPTAIVHATSIDGVEWHEAARDAIAIPAGEGGGWRRHVGQPSVAVDAAGRLVMLFVGRDPASGATAVGRATSVDGVRWAVDDTPVAFDPPTPEAFERDGVAYPTVVARGSELHVWYTGRAGARASIGYAVATESAGGLALVRLGLSLEAEESWESRRVGAPAVLVSGGWLGEPEELGSVMMWYQGGPVGAEGIALAARQVPAAPVQVGPDR